MANLYFFHNTWRNKTQKVKLYKLLLHKLTKTAVSKHLGTGSVISTGLYGNTKITLRDQVFMTIIDYFERNQTKYTMSPENVKSLLCLIFQTIFTTYRQLTLITYIHLRLWFHSKWAALPAPYSQSSKKQGCQNGGPWQGELFNTFSLLSIPEDLFTLKSTKVLRVLCVKMIQDY